MNPLAQFLEDSRTSQAAFASRIGVSPGRVSQLVGGASPSPELAVRMEAESKGEVPADSWGLAVVWNRDQSGTVTGYTVPLASAQAA